MFGSWLVLATLTPLAAQALDPALSGRGEGADQVVVTAAPPLDAERLADALRVYLHGFGIRVETGAAGEAVDLRARLDDARRLGEAVRAVAVVRAERGGSGTVEIELSDLATRKAVVTSVSRPGRDEDLYRALALKIQALLRGTLSEARAELDPRSSLGRLVSERDAIAASRTEERAPPRFGVGVGYGLVAFPLDGPTFAGLAIRALWLPSPRFELTFGSALLGSVTATSADVGTTASIVPFRVTAAIRSTRGRSELLVGPCAEAAWMRVDASSATTPVRSARNVMLAIGGEVEGRVAILTSGWLFARGAVLGVLNGERYDVAGAAVFDTSRLQLTGTIGVGLGLP